MLMQLFFKLLDVHHKPFSSNSLEVLISIGSTCFVLKKVLLKERYLKASWTLMFWFLQRFLIKTAAFNGATNDYEGLCLEHGFPNWGTCTHRGTFAYLKGYI